MPGGCDFPLIFLPCSLTINVWALALATARLCACQVTY